MKLCSIILTAFVSSAFGAPAVVWKNTLPTNNNNNGGRFLHSSEEVNASDLMKSVLTPGQSSSSSLSIVFLVAKGDDGSEQLSELASSGKLPQTSQKYNDAACIHHHVSGIESPSAMMKEAVRATNNGNRVLEVSLDELDAKLNELSSGVEMEIDNQGTMKVATSKASSKRARDLAAADVYIVNVNAKKGDDAIADVDATISKAIDNKSVDSVVLAGVRSIHEVKHERYLTAKRRMTAMEKEGNQLLDARRRRLEQQQDDAAQQDNAANEDMSGVYYVSMTPNIFSALLFMLLFTVITFIGVSCMGSIQGQDTFTDKMPSVGREA
jgi:hypothetical protein